MKDRRRGSAAGGGGDRFAVFPFSMGCMSQSAVSVADPAAETSSKKPPQSEQPSSSSSSSAHQGEAAAGSELGGVVGGDSNEAAANANAKAEAEAAPPGPGGLVATGVSRLMKGIRSLSQMFAAYDGEEDEEEEREMVIGYPTDVQHVGHIGWDGGRSKVGATAMGMVNAFSLPSTLSLHQLEMAMDKHHHTAAQASA